MVTSTLFQMAAMTNSYLTTFPDSTKLHTLEEHVIPFIQQWIVGLGVMSEQGAESIHARFNSLERIYSNMTKLNT